MPAEIGTGVRAGCGMGRVQRGTAARAFVCAQKSMKKNETFQAVSVACCVMQNNATMQCWMQEG